MALDPVTTAFRVILVSVLLDVTITSCGPTSTPPPPSNDGPGFVINSPSENSSVAGPVFFSVQPDDPSTVASVSFRAGSKDLGTDSDKKDGYKVFLVPKDLPAGPLTLTATSTGTDGKTRVKTITVTNVPNPASSGTAGPNGLVLGTTEKNGAVSTLSLPPGAADGASVSFVAKTKEEVKATTGVDYDALGVTFLGAQEINSSKAINGQIGVSSGGFGPAVQPGQAVVQYRVAPDADGDGRGELVVMNTATVAPNGDVVSDPTNRPTLLKASVTTGSSESQYTNLTSDVLAVKVGSRIEFTATGFNLAAGLSTRAIFSSEGRDILTIAPASLKGDAASVLTTVVAFVPALSPGTATVRFRNQTTGLETAAVRLNVATTQLGRPATTILDEEVGRIADDLVKSGDPVLVAKAAKLSAAQADFRRQIGSLTPADLLIVENTAQFITNSKFPTLALASLQRGIARQDCTDSLATFASTNGVAGWLVSGGSILLGGGALTKSAPMALIGGVVLGIGAFLLGDKRSTAIGGLASSCTRASLK